MQSLFFWPTVLIAFLCGSIIGTKNPAIAQVEKTTNGANNDIAPQGGAKKHRVLTEGHSVIVFKPLGKRKPIFRLEIGKVVLFSQDEVQQINKDMEALAAKGIETGVAEFFPNGVKTEPSEKRVWVTERYLPDHYTIVAIEGELMLHNGQDNTSASLGRINVFTDEELPNVKRGTIVDRKIAQEILDRADKYFEENRIDVCPQPGNAETSPKKSETKKDATN